VGSGYHLYPFEEEFVYLAVVLDAFSRKVVGWALDRTLAARWPIAALEQAIAQRQPPPGLVHHSDRGVQYACGDYAQVLQQHRMIPSMSRPANPYDNASCQSLEHLLGNIEVFIEQYYNRCRLHSALGYRPPEEFEQEASPANLFRTRSGSEPNLPRIPKRINSVTLRKRPDRRSRGTAPEGSVRPFCDELCILRAVRRQVNLGYNIRVSSV
jgi:hypothetical protein